MTGGSARAWAHLLGPQHETKTTLHYPPAEKIVAGSYHGVPMGAPKSLPVPISRRLPPKVGQVDEARSGGVNTDLYRVYTDNKIKQETDLNFVWTLGFNAMRYFLSKPVQYHIFCGESGT